MFCIAEKIPAQQSHHRQLICVHKDARCKRRLLKTASPPVKRKGEMLFSAPKWFYGAFS
jgi:hypothetical protein